MNVGSECLHPEKCIYISVIILNIYLYYLYFGYKYNQYKLGISWLLSLTH